MNTYDPCAANKMVNGEIITVVCYVENLMLLHKYTFETTEFYVYLSTIYIQNLYIQIGRVKYYLVIDLDSSKWVMVKIRIIKYLQKVLY